MMRLRNSTCKEIVTSESNFLQKLDFAIEVTIFFFKKKLLI